MADGADIPRNKNHQCNARSAQRRTEFILSKIEQLDVIDLNGSVQANILLNGKRRKNSCRPLLIDTNRDNSCADDQWDAFRRIRIVIWAAGSCSCPARVRPSISDQVKSQLPRNVFFNLQMSTMNAVNKWKIQC
jgi:hypothetical protein